MNIKKYLRQQAEKDAEKLLIEADRLFCLQLAQKAQENKEQGKSKKRKGKWLWLWSRR